MPNVVIVSPFRDNADQIDGYIERIEWLDWPRNHLRVICVEGDSLDGTREKLLAWAIKEKYVSYRRCDVGVPKYESGITAPRFQVLATVFNVGLEAAIRLHGDWASYILVLPSDVQYGSDLLKNLTAHKKDIIAAMFWADDHSNGLRFYDVWGFQDLQGGSFPPLHFSWFEAHLPRQPVEMTTVGGVKLIDIKVLQAGCRYTPEEVDRGLCKAARAKGFSIWCDPETHVVHL